MTAAVEETNEEVNKGLAGFDEINKLSGDISQAEIEQPVVPEISIGGLGESLEIEETEKEMSAFEKALAETFDKISKTIKEAWNSEPVQSFWDATKSIGETGVLAFQIIGASLQGNLKTTWGNIEGDLNTTTSNMSGLWSAFWQDIQVGIDTWGQPIIEGVNGVFSSIWTTAVDPYIQLMVGAWSDFTGILKSKWEEYGQPLIDNIGQFATDVIAEFQSIYDNVLEPIITPFLETMSSLWDEHISVMIDKAVDFVMKLVNGALEIYNEFIHPIVMWLTETLEPVFTWIGNTISAIFETIVSTVSDALGDVFDALGGLIDFITGIFTGDWKKAWEGIKKTFVELWDGVVSKFKGVINPVIDALNVMIKGINKISFDVPDWVPVIGGKQWGFNIPEIPNLAHGAVIPPNREFLAALGDQKQGTNIEAPLSTIQEAVATVISEQNDILRNVLVSSVEVQRDILEAVLGIQIGDEVIGRAVERYSKKMTIMYGG